MEVRDKNTRLLYSSLQLIGPMARKPAVRGSGKGSNGNSSNVQGFLNTNDSKSS